MRSLPVLFACAGLLLTDCTSSHPHVLVGQWLAEGSRDAWGFILQEGGSAEFMRLDRDGKKLVQGHFDWAATDREMNFCFVDDEGHPAAPETVGYRLQGTELILDRQPTLLGSRRLRRLH